MRMFRDFKVVDDVIVDIPFGRILFNRVDLNYVKIVKTLNSSTSSKLINLSTNEFIRLRPKQPSGNTINTYYALVKFSEPITLLPKSSFVLNLKLPTDLGIYVKDSLVDTAPLSKVKYSLYGPSDIGDLCRYIDKGIVDSTPREFLGSMYLTVNSVSDDTINMSKVVIPIDGLAIFVTSEGEIFFNDVSVRATSQNHFEVSTRSNASQLHGEITYSSKVKESTYVMRYGA